MERGLDAPESDRASHSRFDEVGQGFALPENGLEFSTQLWFDTDLGYDSGLHGQSVLRLRYGCNGPPRRDRQTGRQKWLVGQLLSLESGGFGDVNRLYAQGPPGAPTSHIASAK